MSKLENLVPPLELCKQIPAGEFEPPQSSLFGCRFDNGSLLTIVADPLRLNLACLAVGSTYKIFSISIVVNRLNLACLAVGSTPARRQGAEAQSPPQSSLFGCRFDHHDFAQVVETESRLNLACLAVGSTHFR